MKKTNDSTMIYVYTKGSKRMILLSPLEPLEMAMNKIKLADVIQQENGLEWFNKVNEHAEALINLMGRIDRNEAIEWVNYLFGTMKVENKDVEIKKEQRYWFIKDIDSLESEKGLTQGEEDRLNYALSILETNINKYGFNIKTEQFPD